ncbi:MAG: hypothetical protein BJ554DRAFT_4963 [Olpidium bornovanus]|uniref:WW domain-containing protein n=1 Tax=Olpidium bornovanus TaxID=278681 RepID=A0A8H8DLQ2_9FUNG|nr:MAG: hypothetical protein BJ554DRAFT_4963 [Olpidium bornovanus]
MAGEHGARGFLYGAPEGFFGAKLAEAVRRSPESDIFCAGDSGTEWIRIIDPQTQNAFYANPVEWKTGRTGGISQKETDPAPRRRRENPGGEWWELYDEQHKLPYYYNTLSGQSEWARPATGTIIPLSSIQNSALGKRASVALKRGSTPAEGAALPAAGSPRSAGAGGGTSPQNARGRSAGPSSPLQHQSAYAGPGASRAPASAGWPGGGGPGHAGLQAMSPLPSSSAPFAAAAASSPGSAGGMRLEHARKSISAAEAARSGGISDPVVNRG